MRLFWLIMAIIAVILLWLWWQDTQDTGMATNHDHIARASHLGIVALLIASSLLASGLKIGVFIRHCLIWFAMIMALILGYHHRYTLQDIGYQLTAGIIPSSPLVRYEAGKTSVTLWRGSNGHFETNALVNGKGIRFMLDTGASRIVLSHDDARQVGLDVENLRYTISTATANGLAQAAPVQLRTVHIGGIERQNIAALVTRPDAMSGSLLGMSFLNSLSGYTVRADQLTLVD